MAENGGFKPCGDAIESHGGPGILWYEPVVFSDFVLRIEWRVRSLDDNSGVFIRIPPLDAGMQRAIDEGYEIQIHERGLDPETGRLGSPLHITGAVYKLAPATARSSRPIGDWNAFEIAVRGPSLAVRLNGVPVCRLDEGRRRRSGHVGLQAHHDGSRVAFRNLSIVAL